MTSSATQNQETSNSGLPIVVDLDKTLILTDSLHEQAATGIFTRPLATLALAPKLSRGRAALKQAFSETIAFSAETLPLR